MKFDKDFNAEGISLLDQLGSAIPASFSADIPFSAFLELAYSVLVTDESDSANQAYLHRANQLRQEGALCFPLPMIAVCCFDGALLERVLKRLRDSGCSLDATSPASTPSLLLSQLSESSNDWSDPAPFWVRRYFEIQSQRVEDPFSKISPLLLMVSIGHMQSIRILLKLGALPNSV